MISTPNQGTTLDIVTWTLFPITFIACCIRFRADGRNLRLHTYLFYLTLLIVMAGQAFTTISVYHGMGQHVSSLDPVRIMNSLKWGWMAQISQLLANATAKLGIMSYLRQVIGRAMPRSHCIALWTSALLQITFNIVLDTLILTQCSPVQKLWNEALPGSCNGRIRNLRFAFVHGLVSTLTDVVLAVYPPMFFWRIKADRKKKMLLGGVFGSGLLAAACSCVKILNLNRITNTKDITYELARLIIWNAAETYTVIIAGSIPVIYSYFNKYRKTAHIAGDQAALKSTSMPLGRTEGYPSGATRNTAIHMNGDDNSEEFRTEDRPNAF